MTDLTVHEHGDAGAATVVLLHGLTDSGPSWADAIARWSPRYRVLAVDQLGHGASPRFTAEQLALPDPMQAAYDALVVALEARATGPVTLVGHSMGAAMAATLGARRPDLVRALVLEDPAWFDLPPDHDRAATAGERVADAATAAADLDAEVALGRHDHPHWPEAELRPWAEASATFDPGFGLTGLVVVAEPWRELAARISAPTLVVTGTDRVIITPEVQAEIEELGNRHLEIAVVEGAGHCVRRDDREAFHALVDPWLAHHTS